MEWIIVLIILIIVIICVYMYNNQETTIKNKFTSLSPNVGACSAVCGNGNRIVEYVCSIPDQNGNYTIPCPSGESACKTPLKPNSVLDRCNLAECSNWITSEWGNCDKTCGGGTKTRSVTCPTNMVCDPNSKPVFSQPCNTVPCGTWVITAIYGSTNNVDVTEKIRSFLNPDGTWKVSFWNQSYNYHFGDPQPGQVKILNIKYSVNGVAKIASQNENSYFPPLT